MARAPASSTTASWGSAVLRFRVRVSVRVGFWFVVAWTTPTLWDATARARASSARPTPRIPVTRAKRKVGIRPFKVGAGCSVGATEAFDGVYL